MISLRCAFDADVLTGLLGIQFVLKCLPIPLLSGGPTYPLFAESGAPNTSDVVLCAPRSGAFLLNRLGWFIMHFSVRVYAIFVALHLVFATPSAAQDVAVAGELKRWHPISLTFDGPQATEEGNPNPFLDYRLVVTFSQGNTSITVPGYFAADGNSAESGATSGDQWRAHFLPPETGVWTYDISMRAGTEVALSKDPLAGNPSAGDGLSGSFSISETDKPGRDFRGKGMLRYAGQRYLQFDDGTSFIKGGADSPENFLGYYEFDNTEDFGCQGNTLTDGLHRYTAHETDWNTGDPVWQTNKGKGIIGAVNYLASKGINSIYFLTMNTQGDGCEVYPWTSYGSNPAERLRYDVSKLDQWNIVFDHMDTKGIMLHVVTQETENDQLLDGGDLGTQRKLYYRELVARFGYHHAITWNLGEENTNTHAQRVQFAEEMAALDPYGHLVVVHTFPSAIGSIYDDLLGYPNENPVQTITGNSIQRGLNDDIHAQVLKWIDRSAEMNHQWVVSLDEIGPAGVGAKPDGAGNNHREIREEALWATLMAGGAGVEWYFGYNNPHDDLDMEDWRSRDDLWTYTAAATDFFLTHLPFEEMRAADALIDGDHDYVFAKTGEVYAVYLKQADLAGSISLPAGTYSVAWYNPRDGTMQTGTITEVSGQADTDFGQPPFDTDLDWALLIRNVGGISYRPPDEPVSIAPGIQFAYFEGEWGALPDFSALTAITTGISSNIDLSDRQRDNGFAMLFAGFISVPKDGIYTFYTRSDDGSRLLIGDQVVVDNDGTHAAIEKQGSIALAEGLHALRVQYFENAGQEELAVSWTIPGEARQVLRDADLFYDTDNLLPVELVDFRGLVADRSVALFWETASERNNAGFEIERAFDPGFSFEKIGFVEGQGTSLVSNMYQFTDEHLPDGAASLWYRLKQVDFDGAFSFSDVIEIPLQVPESVQLAQNYPNPFNPITTIRFTVPVRQRIRLSVYDALGRLVDVLRDEITPAGYHAVTFEAGADDASGLYIYHLHAGDKVFTGSMMLLK